MTLSLKTPETDLEAIASELAKSGAWAKAFTADTERFECIQTHISHVFIVGDRVFKLRKAVAMPFLDFRSRDARNEDCVREVALNRRLAPDVYLGIAPIVWDGETIRLGSLCESITVSNCEHVVVMRRLPAGGDALALLEKNQLSPDHLRDVTKHLAAFHKTHALGSPAPWSQDDWFARIANPVLESIATVRAAGMLESAETKSLPSTVNETLEALRSDFERRRLAGKAVDGHGDLHLDHLWFEAESAVPLIIDCLEFNEDLRRIDAASEVAFLAMDLSYRGRADLAEAFLSAYALETDDYDLFTVVDFYQAYRALVRSKVASFAMKQKTIQAAQREKARASAIRHAELAARLLEPRRPGELVLLCGTVGSGKSTVARYLADSGCGVPIASDRVRKIISSVPLTTHAPSSVDEGIYQPEMNERVYEELLNRADQIIASGRTAILDASFSRRAARDHAQSWAEERGLSTRLIEVRCKHDVALDRLQSRAAQGTDPSDAGPSFLSTSEDRFEPPDEWPESDHTIVWTS